MSVSSSTRDKKLRSDKTLQEVVDEHYKEIGDSWEVIGNTTNNIVHIGFPGDIEKTNTALELEVLQPVKETYPKPIVIIDWQAEHLTILSHTETDEDTTLEFWNELKSRVEETFEINRVDEDALIIYFLEGQMLREKPVPRSRPNDNVNENQNQSGGGFDEDATWDEKVREARENHPASFVEIDEEQKSIHIDSHMGNNTLDLYERRSNKNVQTWDEYKEENNL